MTDLARHDKHQRRPANVPEKHKEHHRNNQNYGRRGDRTSGVCATAVALDGVYFFEQKSRLLAHRRLFAAFSRLYLWERKAFLLP